MSFALYPGDVPAFCILWGRFLRSVVHVGCATVSRVEFEIWWDAEVAPNQEINRRAAALEKFKEEAAGWVSDPHLTLIIFT